LYKQLSAAGHDDQRELLARILFYRHGLQNCYVLREGDAIAYLQWIVYPSENDVLERKYRGHYLPLQNHQVMLENAFTLQPFRGRGFHPHATAELLNRARAEGYRVAVSYIKPRSISSLNNFISMGFKIHRLIREYRLVGRVWRAVGS
jgi:L-amino acid N-acyltransferase YncA